MIDSSSHTILVTGGYGFIGSNFIRLLRRRQPGCRIVNLDKLTYASSKDNLGDVEERDSYRVILGDVVDTDLVNSVFEEERPDWVVHFAAETHVDRSILDPAQFLETNVLGTRVMLDAARAFVPQRFVYISTDEVYGDSGRVGKIFTEDSPLKPSSPYSWSKASADMLVQAYHRTYGMPLLIVRPCNNFGPCQFPEKLIPVMISKILRGETLPIYGDGRQIRDWMYVEDGAQGILSILDEGQDGAIYNIAAQHSVENRQLVSHICEIMAELLEKNFQDLWSTVEFVDDRPGHDFRYAIDDQRVRTDTDWRPEVAIEEGLRRTVKWWLSNENRLVQMETDSYAKYHNAIYGNRRK